MAATPTSAAWQSDPQFSWIPQNVQSAFLQSGLTPSATPGTGFADANYWHGVGPSQYNRWAADILGTGTDQPTGTPGQGIWDQSGQGSAPQQGMSTSDQADQILSQVEGNVNGYVRQLLGNSIGTAPQV